MKSAMYDCLVWLLSCVMTFRLNLETKLKVYNDYFASITQQQVAVKNVSNILCTCDALCLKTVNVFGFVTTLNDTTPI